MTETIVIACLTADSFRVVLSCSSWKFKELTSMHFSTKIFFKTTMPLFIAEPNEL